MEKLKSSEIASYTFCPVCWWTERVRGVVITQAISKGEQYHNTIAKNRSTAKFLYNSVIILTFIILILIVYRVLA